MSLLPSRSLENIELSYKKMHDGNPLRLWKCAAELDAPPVELLHRVLNGESACQRIPWGISQDMTLSTIADILDPFWILWDSVEI